MFRIIEIEANLGVLEENGQNVLFKDCVRFGISRKERFLILGTLFSVVDTMRRGESLEHFVDKGLLKKLDRQPKTQLVDLWEVRDEGHRTRLIFVRKAPDSIIVSAVSKLSGSHSEAINRGVNRWINYLRQKGE